MELSDVVIVAIIGAISGLVAGWLQFRGQREERESLKAEAVRIYQEMALKETHERERLEASFERKIKALKEEIDTLHGENETLRRENEDLKLERSALLESFDAERKQWAHEHSALTEKLQKLQGEINKLKRSTGQLR